jgi:hypothetical protein
VAIAVVMGASVIAAGRYEDTLHTLAETYGGRVKTVTITSSVESDIAAIPTAVGVSLDAVLKISPREAADSTVIKSCISALRYHGRMDLMSGIKNDIAITNRPRYALGLAVEGEMNAYEGRDVSVDQAGGDRDVEDGTQGGILKL